MSLSVSCPLYLFLGSTRKIHIRNLDPFHRKLSTSKRRRFSPKASSLVLPLLPFNVSEVLVPSESKILHLYEARYLDLLEESLIRKNLFVHFVLDPIAISDSAAEVSFATRFGCLVLIENVERLDVGALITIRGIGRVKIIKFFQAEPYLKGEVIPMQDTAPDCSSDVISSELSAVMDAVYSLNILEIKLKYSSTLFLLQYLPVLLFRVPDLLFRCHSGFTIPIAEFTVPLPNSSGFSNLLLPLLLCPAQAPKEALLQTQIVNSLLWADKEPSLDCDDAFVPSLAERISFATFQPVTGSSQSEVVKLQQKK
ncbi:hypothetical protein Dsin_001892 [Dipteronia sinensis]|uniref:Lon N-terminal domain-containing protein n=1 Tax=Dipteronia sinensis TaxID=43782 RepID=A0AAE0B582_9ROSI|nr:hypothetical protein Dsin_001892 [Dipteronia sinensis]